MNGAVYYERDDAARNQLFIGDLIRAAAAVGMTLELITEKPSAPYDFILFRSRDSALARELEDAGYLLVNRAAVNEAANDKLRTFELASLLGVAAVPVLSVNAQLDFPVVLKTRDGHGGSEVFLCRTADEADEVKERFGSRLIAQPYIESGAADVRVFMLGCDVLGAVKRTGADGFKSNFTLGGTAERYTLDASELRDVQRIARALNSDYIGIDFLLPKSGGWLLNEIEDPVGARSLYDTHDFSVAEKLVDYVKRKLEDM